VGFPVTICVVCYGPHADLAERFLQSLYCYTDASLFHLRAGLNEAEPATHRLFDEYVNRFGNIDLFVECRNVFKNPLMRRIFYEKPLTSRWTIWCDDDTHFTRPDWLQRLALKIETSPKTPVWSWIHLLWRRDKAILDWIRRAPWYRGVPFLRGVDLDGKPAVEFRFAPGAFWAAQSDVLHRLDWPDPRLVHANEDFLFGEALRQAGARLGKFRHGIAFNDAPRRNADAVQVRALPD